jgi:CHAT domain-containing protein
MKPTRLSAAAKSVIAVLLLAAVGATIWKFVRKTPAQSIVALATIANALPYRQTPGRLSGPFDYRPVARIIRGTDEVADDTEVAKRLIAWTEAKSQAVKNPSVETLHALGIASLLKNDAVGATAALEEALRRSTGESETRAAIRKTSDVPLLVDLTAALCVTIRDDSEGRVLLTAESAQRAWTLARTATTAWNRALAAQRLHLDSFAREAWDEYLHLDATSAWAAEARARRDAAGAVSGGEWEREREQLIRAAAASDERGAAVVIQRFPQESRVYAEDELLPAWAASVASGRSDAAVYASRIALIGKILEAFNGDAILQDTATRLHTLSGLPDGRARLQGIADAMRLYSEGREQYRQQAPERAIPLLSEAAEAFRRERIPLWIRAEVFRATSDVYAGRLEHALVALRRLTSHPSATTRYPSAIAQALWSEAITEFSRGKSIESRSHYIRGAALFDQLHESENGAFLHMLLGQNLRYLGHKTEAWRQYLNAARSLSSSGSGRRTPQILGYIAREALDSGYDGVAAFFSDAAAGHHAAADPIFRIEALIASARGAMRVGDRTQAEAALNEAAGYARAVRDPKIARRQELDIRAISVEEGLVLNAAGEQNLTAAIELATADHDTFRLGRFHFLRGKVRAALGADPEADYDAAFAQWRAGGSAVAQGNDRRQWRDQFRAAMDTAIADAVARGRIAKALEWVDAARGRRIEDDAVLLAKGRLILAYWSTEAELFAWGRSNDVLEFRTIPIARSQLRASVHEIRSNLVERHYPNARSDLATAYDALIRPFGPSLRNSSEVIIVPDEMMTGLPFPALVERESGQYLIEQLPVTLATTVNAASNVGSIIFSRADHATVVANPAFDQELLPSLDRLPNSVAEIATVRRYFVATSVMEREATIGAFTNALRHSAFVHYAGHSMTNADDDESSALILAPAEGGADSGLLYAKDIATISSASLRLVVLSSCSSASGDSEDADFSPLARAFLSTGVPAVIGSLWKIRDGDHVELMSSFYEAAQRTDVAGALRIAQMKMARRSDDLSWAAFELIAGGTSGSKNRE